MKLSGGQHWGAGFKLCHQAVILLDNPTVVSETQSRNRHSIGARRCSREELPMLPRVLTCPVTHSDADLVAG